MDLIDRPEEVPWGGGEPACAVAPSAIAGAVFEATGVRLRSVPFTRRQRYWRRSAPPDKAAASPHAYTDLLPRGAGPAPTCRLTKGVLA